MIKINNAEEHQQCLLEVSGLIDKDPEPATDDGERLILLANSIAAYEKTHFNL